MNFKSTAITGFLIMLGVSTMALADKREKDERGERTKAGEFECKTVVGKVTLTPDSNCNINNLYSGPTYLFAPGTCFSVTLRGTVSGTGYAGMTIEPIASPITQTGGSTIAILNEQGLPSAPNEFGLPETRRVFTARSVLSLPGGRVFTADAGIIDGTTSTEQLVMTRGDGRYTGGKGTFHAFGNLFAGGSLVGELCSLDD